MVDSRKGTAMADEVEIEQRIEQLASSVKSGFNGVDEAFADQRLDTELAVARVSGDVHRLDAKIDARFSRLERRIEEVLDLRVPRVPPGAPEGG